MNRPTMKSRIIFYRHTSDLLGMNALYRMNGSMSSKERYDLVQHFDKKEFAELFVAAPYVRGWATSLSPDECCVMFIGGGWGKEELLQGEARIRP